jgi:hypothetical protein
MPTLAALDRISELLDIEDDATVGTSMRLPANLREAAAIAVEQLGVAPSTTMLTAAALRSVLDVLVKQAALDEHYRQRPSARPTLAEVALALAAQDGSPLAEQQEVVAAAAQQVLERHPDADADDVLLWAEAQQAALARSA